MPTALSSTRCGGLELLRDLHDLYLLAGFSDMAWTLVGQAAQGARATERLIRTVDDCAKETRAQQQWLTTRLQAAAPRALVVVD